MKYINKYISILIVLLLLAAPIAVYIFKFGYQISNKHERWAEMGSAISGIYTPLLSVMTLLVLYYQLNANKKTNKIQQDMNEFNKIDRFIQDAKTDARLCLSALKFELHDSKNEDNSFYQNLIANFTYKTIEELNSPELYKIAEKLNEKNPSILAIWHKFYSVFILLNAKNEYPYEHNLVNIRNEAFIIVPYAGCVALDNLSLCLTKGKVNYNYEYSDIYKT